MCNRLLPSDRAVDTSSSNGKEREANNSDSSHTMSTTSTTMMSSVLMDGQAMRDILTRDQRTTCHRMTRSSSSSSSSSSSTTTSEVMSAGRILTCCNSGDVKDVLRPSSSCVPACCRDSSSSSSSSKSRTQLDMPRDVERGEVVSGVDESCDDDKEPREDCREYETMRCRRGMRSARIAMACTTWLRLGSLLVALLAVTVHGAPTTMSLESHRLGSAPKWLNPCGLSGDDFAGDIDIPQLSDEMIIGNIITTAKTALYYAQDFRDEYIKKTFNTDYADLHVQWKDNHYDWLPSSEQIPKQLGEPLDSEYLDKLEVRMLDTALLDAYEYMQRYAVGLEQIAWDQEDNRLEFKEKFQTSEHNLQSVLCELQMAIAERSVQPRPDITRDIMSQEFRGMAEVATYRNLRDWLIFRDYMNGLEYIIEVFDHLLHKIAS